MTTTHDTATGDARISRPFVPSISGALEAKGIPASAVVVADGWVYVSGLPPMSLETGEYEVMTIEAQTRVVLERLKECLEVSGSSLDRVIKCTVYCSNAGYFQAINDIYAEYFADHRPARTFVCTAGWFGPFDVEIDCVALV